MGRFITFEGPEGSGKSTQIRLLAAALEAQGLRVLTTREPGGTCIGDAVRSILLNAHNTTMSPRTEALLFNAARAQLVDEVIRPALDAGLLVLCDRYADSTLAYQGYGRGQSLEPLRLLGRYATDGLTPDLTFYLDIDPVEGLRRKQTGAAEEWNRMEQQQLAFHRAVREGYLALARAEQARWTVIEAGQDAAVVHHAILARVTALLPVS